MADRVNLIDRRGINAFENFVLNKLKWIFREQPITDIGIDAYIEQVINGDSTGKLIAVQVKTGIGNVSINKDANFDYYMSIVHYNYWLSYPIPVIIVLYNPDDEKLYWNSIFKRNISKTKNNNNKITIDKKSVCLDNTLADFEEIITLYESKSFLDKNMCQIESEEVWEYCSELFFRCSESLRQIRTHIDQLQLDYVRGMDQMQMFLKTNKSGCSKEIANREVRKVANIYILALNVCRTRINNEIPLMVDVFMETFQCLERCVLPVIRGLRSSETIDFITEELTNLQKSIDSLVIMTDAVSERFINSKNWTCEFSKAEKQFSKVVQDYKCELIDLSSLILLISEKIKIA